MKNNFESKILELAAEDAYGSWELWWEISANITDESKEIVRRKFIDTIKELVEAKKLDVYNHKAMGDYQQVSFDSQRLEFEIENSNAPNPDEFYWFSTPK